jgi:hypothetical protein
MDQMVISCSTSSTELSIPFESVFLQVTDDIKVLVHQTFAFLKTINQQQNLVNRNRMKFSGNLFLIDQYVKYGAGVALKTWVNQLFGEQLETYWHDYYSPMVINAFIAFIF